MHSLLRGLLLLVGATGRGLASGTSNILLIIDESTDGRAYFPGQTPPMPIPNLQRVMREGMTFNFTFVPSPVCCPSRAALWSGKNIHDIPHTQPTGLFVRGAWNNFEGLQTTDNSTIDQILAAAGSHKVRTCEGGTCFSSNPEGGFEVDTLDKMDRVTGAHTVNVRAEAWTNKVNFPYDMSFQDVLTNPAKLNRSGWADEFGPITQTHNGTANGNDWTAVGDLVAWIHNMSEVPAEPWFGYIGMTIVHPDYISNQTWLDEVDLTHPALKPPAWEKIEDMHPEDFRASLLKGMGGPETDNDEYKIDVRHHYYAMIAEYDSMVGSILEALDATKQADNTWVIITSDHGDMNMEHRQYYKMDWHDASARVPLIIRGPGIVPSRIGATINSFVWSLDLFPTILELAGLGPPSPSNHVAGTSLVPFFSEGSADDDRGHQDLDPPRLHVASLVHRHLGQLSRPVMSQFAGDNVHLPWFALMALVNGTHFKYVAYSSGLDVPHRLFNLDVDPEEKQDLLRALNADDMKAGVGVGVGVGGERARQIAEELDAQLNALIARTSSDGYFQTYREVSLDIESYNKESFVLWRSNFANESSYEEQMASLRWAPFWAQDPEGCLQAIEKWLRTSNDTGTWNCTYGTPPASWSCPWDWDSQGPQEAAEAV